MHHFSKIKQPFLFFLSHFCYLHHCFSPIFSIRDTFSSQQKVLCLAKIILENPSSSLHFIYLLIQYISDLCSETFEHVFKCSFLLSRKMAAFPTFSLIIQSINGHTKALFDHSCITHLSSHILILIIVVIEFFGMFAHNRLTSYFSKVVGFRNPNNQKKGFLNFAFCYFQLLKGWKV